MTEQVLLTESGGTITKEHSSKGVYRVQLIEADVQGSSGYYPADVLERDGSKVFPAGTHIYFDHPTVTEEAERPERSVKDLAAVLLDPAKFETTPTGRGLFSRMQVFPAHKEHVEALAAHVGMSIRATGLTKYNPLTEREEVTALLHADSVDIVTRAGAGGRILEMVESARPAGETQTPTQLFAELKESDKAGMQKLFEAVSSLAPLMESFKERLEALEEKAATVAKEREEEAALSLGEIVAKLDDSGLPSVSRKHLANSYAPGVDLDAAIADEKSRVDAIKAELGAAQPEAETVETVQESARGGRMKETTSGDTYTQANELLSSIFS